MKKNLIFFLVIVIILCSLYNNIEPYENNKQKIKTLNK